MAYRYTIEMETADLPLRVMHKRSTSQPIIRPRQPFMSWAVFELVSLTAHGGIEVGSRSSRGSRDRCLLVEVSPRLSVRLAHRSLLDHAAVLVLVCCHNAHVGDHE
jgi:hypothetical protein